MYNILNGTCQTATATILFIYFVCVRACLSVYVYGCPQGPEEGFESFRAGIPNVSTQNQTLVFWRKEKGRKFLPGNFKYSKGIPAFFLAVHRQFLWG